ncbi:MAG: hypothetical protein QW211_06530 [Desulfurococcaceae archaeon]
MAILAVTVTAWLATKRKPAPPSPSASLSPPASPLTPPPNAEIQVDAGEVLRPS